MIKRVNFTGRKRLPRRIVAITVHDGQPRTFDALIHLEDAKLPADAIVYLEAMCAGSNAIQRFEYGRVGAIMPPSDRRLSELQGENVFFALKVVDGTESIGRILGLAENIRPEHGGKQTATGRRGILPIEAADLGQRLWRLEYKDHDVFLLVNQNVPGLKDRARYDALFYAAIYPAVIREILERAFDEYMDDDDERWPALWLQFGKNLHPGGETPPVTAPDERREWIDAVVDAFCLTHALSSKYAAAMPEVETTP